MEKNIRRASFQYKKHGTLLVLLEWLIPVIIFGNILFFRIGIIETDVELRRMIIPIAIFNFYTFTFAYAGFRQYGPLFLWRFFSEESDLAEKYKAEMYQKYTEEIEKSKEHTAALIKRRDEMMLL